MNVIYMILGDPLTLITENTRGQKEHLLQEG